MFINKKIKYGMKALLYLTKFSEREAVSASKLSKELDVPKEFISKIMQSLVHHGILKSKKGKGGGFYLAVPPDEVKYEIVFRILGYKEANNECLFDMHYMCDRRICPFCENWKEFIHNFSSSLKSYAISGKRLE